MLRKFPVALCIVALAATAFGNVTFYTDRAAFDAAVPGPLVGTEDFEELGIPPYSLVCYPYPPSLQGPPGVGNISGPMALYSNYFDPTCDLVGLGAGFIGNATTVVGPNFFVANLSADFGAMPGPEPQEGPDYGGFFAVAYERMCRLGPGTYTVNVYDKSNVLIGSANVACGAGETFLGIIADGAQGPIGRIEDTGYSVLTDNWEMYVPEPSALLLLVFGGLLLLRRR